MNNQRLTARVPQPVSERRHVFISYSRADRNWVERLQRMMAPLLRGSGQEIRLWDDSQIVTGRKWREQIETALVQAKVALLLVSDHFLASKFVMGEEVPRLLEAAEAEGLRVLWVSLTACLVEKTEIYQYQAVLPHSRPLDQMSEAEMKEALKAISLAIHEAMTDQKQTSGTVEPSQNPKKEMPVHQPDPQNLDSLWKMVLAHLQLPSTRTLFSQQAKLLCLDADRAVVGVSHSWAPMAQSRLSLLENAIAQAFGSRRTLVLEVINDASSPEDTGFDDMQ
jgi:hypothetical protein